MNIETASRVLAKACGIEINEYEPPEFLYKDKYSSNFIVWAISDARCREVVREHFKIITDYTGGKWNAHAHLETQRVYGKTISEAEMSCMIKIAEQLETESDDEI